MKYIILFIFSFSILFAQDNFLDEIVLNEVERIYPNDEIVAPNSFNISMNFDLNRYRLNEPILILSIIISSQFMIIIIIKLFHQIIILYGNIKMKEL